ncbi:hypothetical protein HID58_054007, partial [Brassica napus]
KRHDCLRRVRVRAAAGGPLSPLAFPLPFAGCRISVLSPICLWICGWVTLPWEDAREFFQIWGPLCFWWFHGEATRRFSWQLVFPFVYGGWFLGFLRRRHGPAPSSRSQVNSGASSDRSWSSMAACERYARPLHFRTLLHGFCYSSALLLADVNRLVTKGKAVLGLSFPPRCLLLTAIASTCSFGEGFTRRWRDIQTGFDGTAKPCGKYLDFSPMAVMCFIYRERYKFRGVHWKLATPETSRELPASEATRRTSLSQEPRRRLRTATDIKHGVEEQKVLKCVLVNQRGSHIKIHHTEEDLGCEEGCTESQSHSTHRTSGKLLVDRHRNMPGLLSELLYPAD